MSVANAPEHVARPEAVVFLSPASQQSGLPPELELVAGVPLLERFAEHFRAQGFSELRAILLTNEEGPDLQREKAYQLLLEIATRTAAIGISLSLETAATLEDWLTLQSPDADWLVLRPNPAELAPRNATVNTDHPWLRRMQERTGLGTISSNEKPAPQE